MIISFSLVLQTVLVGFFLIKGGKFGLYLIEGFRYNVARIRNFPGVRIILDPHSFTFGLPRLRGFNLGSQFVIREGYSLFKQHGRDAISIVSLFPPHRMFHLADPVAIKHVLSNQRQYQKTPSWYNLLSHFGPNVLISNGETWKRHSKVVSGSLRGESTLQVAWEEAQRVLSDCFSEWEIKTRAEGEQFVEVKKFVDTTLKLSLFVLMRTLFSKSTTWGDKNLSVIPKGHRVSLRTAMHGVTQYGVHRALIPQWAYKLPIPQLRHIEECFRDFELYVQEQIAERRAFSSDPRTNPLGRKDLLGTMCYANARDSVTGVRDEIERDKDRLLALTDDELMGNMFVLMAAGHETTANMLVFALTLLALHPDEQQKLFEHISDVLPMGEEPVYADFPSLSRVQAVINETLRLFPPAVILPKMSMEDDMLPTSTGDQLTPGEGIFVPKWTDVIINCVALHRNRKYWGDDADRFRPDRFIDAPDGSYTWPRDAFVGFSGGARSCSGQKFALVVATAFMTGILQKYSVHLGEDFDGSGAKRAAQGETFEDRMKRVTKCSTLLLLSLEKSDLVFKRR
ncbi:cytochrome P450 [Meredithblackwellia eburnea MCA 4105]